MFGLQEVNWLQGFKMSNSGSNVVFTGHWAINCMFWWCLCSKIFLKMTCRDIKTAKLKGNATIIDEVHSCISAFYVSINIHYSVTDSSDYFLNRLFYWLLKNSTFCRFWFNILTFFWLFFFFYILYIFFTILENIQKGKWLNSFF